MIPGATKAATKGADVVAGAAYGFCGAELVSINAGNAKVTICSKI